MTTAATSEHQQRNDAVLLYHYRQRPQAWALLIQDTTPALRREIAGRLRNAGASEEEIGKAMGEEGRG